VASNLFLMGNRTEVAEGLRRFRERHELSQAEFSVLSGVALRTVQNLESQSTRPAPFTLMKIDDFLRKYERSAKVTA